MERGFEMKDKIKEGFEMIVKGLREYETEKKIIIKILKEYKDDLLELWVYERDYYEKLISCGNYRNKYLLCKNHFETQTKKINDMIERLR
jgi:hypothetical protein